MGYHWNNAGGWNREHDQVERTPRLDSFDIDDSCRGITYIGKEDDNVLLDYLVTYCGEKAIIEFSHYGARLKEKLELSRLYNGFGAAGQTFFVCPICKKRRRFIYLYEKRFICRECAALNYRRQQATRDSMFWYNLGMKYAKKHFAPSPFEIDGFEFCTWTPDKPKGQHETTYLSHLKRFERYQYNHARQLNAEIAELLKKYL